MIRKLGKNYQIALPRKVVKNLHLNVDDYVDITIDGTRIIIEPQVIIPKSQIDFFTEDVKSDIKKSEDDFKKGRYSEYASGDDLKKEIESD